MKKRKAYLLLELDSDEIVNLPPHLRGLLSRPLIEPIQERRVHDKPWCPTEQQKRERRRQERIARLRAEQAEAIKRGDLLPPEQK